MNSTSGQGNTDNRAAASTRLASLRRFLEAEPGNDRLRRDVVNTAVAAGEFEYLRTLAEGRLADSPGDAEAQFDRATALMGLRDFAGALEALKPLDATIPGVRANTALCHFFLEQYAQALPYFKASYDAGDRGPQTLRYFLLSLHHAGELDSAPEIINANESVFAANALLAGHASTVFQDLNDEGNAAKWAQVALARDPDNVDALVVSGTLRAAALDVNHAKAAFERALALAPQNGRAWLGLGSLALLTQDFERAGEQLDHAVEYMPTHVGSWHALAWNQYFMGKVDEAGKSFEHALVLNRNFSESHGGVAVIAATRGDRAAAERAIEVAERLDPHCNTSKFARALLAGQAGGPEALQAAIAQGVDSLSGLNPRVAALLRRANRQRKNN